MALPSGMSTWTGTPERSGIVVGLYPSTLHRLAVELHYSTQTTASTSSTKWTIRRVPASSASLLQQTIILPLSTRRWFFKARHKDTGWANGPFTAVVNARPVVLGAKPATPLVRYGFKGNVELPGADLWLQSTKTAKVGTQASTATITKTFIVPHSALVPGLDTYTISHTQNYISSRTTNAIVVHGPIVLPPNVTITKVETGVFRSSTADTLDTKLYEIKTSDASATLRATLTYSTGTGWRTLASSAMSLGTSSPFFSVQVSMNPAGIFGDNARFSWYRLSYKMPSYDRSL